MIAKILPLLVVFGAVVVKADTCYDYYGRPYYCYDNGLSYGARVGIGIGVAALILLCCMGMGYWRRRNLRNQWSKYRPPVLPVHQNAGADLQPGGGGAGYSYGQGNNPYGNNPPPPTGGNWGGASSFSGQNPYGANPPAPPQTYQPSMAGQYGGMRPVDTGTTVDMNKTGNGRFGGGGGGETEHEHGYEWEQAREAERIERERAQAEGGAGAGMGGAVGGEAPPPGYDVAASQHNTGNSAGYAPPTGPPPGK